MSGNLLGNPLQNKKYLNEMKKYFADHEIPGCSDNAIYWEKIPKYIIRNDEYRDIRVGNIQHMLNVNRFFEHDIFRSIAEGLIELRKTLTSFKRKPNESQKDLETRFRESLFGSMKNKNYMKSIAEFLNTDQDMAIECFLSASCYQLLALDSAAASFIVAILAIILNINPLISVSISAVFAFFAYRSAKKGLLYEKQMNYVLALKQIFSCFYFYPEKILKSNIFVLAIDERRCSPLNFKPNYGTWCDFIYIDDLKGAPIASNTEYRDLLKFYKDIYQKITVNDQFDCNKISDYLNTGILDIRSFSWDKDDDSKELEDI